MTRILAILLMVILVHPAIAQRKYNRVPEARNSKLYIYMVKVKGGSFDMGSNKEGSDRKPLHTVKLNDFSIGEYEVTQDQWNAVMGSDPSMHHCDQCPVTNVSWNDVQAFIEKLNTMTGKHYRLPTEAEWEYAARGGANEQLVKEGRERGGVNVLTTDPNHRRVPDKYTTGKLYSGRNSPQEVAWFDRDSRDHIHPIGRKQPNELGIYDMSGNVEEWCADWYAGNYGSKNTVENPQGPEGGKSKVVRGGSWSSPEADITVTRRGAYLPDTRTDALGFRLVEGN